MTSTRESDMSPSELRRTTLSQLRRVLSAMMSPEWDLALEGRPRAEVTRAAELLLAVQRARLRLGTAELAVIRDGMVANEAALREGSAAVNAALANLKEVQRLIEATASYLRIVGRIIAMAA
jgi:Xaa-Pro aminopeptidase